MKAITGLVVLIFLSSVAEAIDVNKLIRQQIKESVTKKASPPPAPAAAPGVAPVTPAPVPAVAPVPAPAPSVAVSTPVADFIKKIWSSIPQAKSTCFDAGTPISKNITDSSGRALYCYLSSLASLDQIQKLAGVAIFSSGPHKEKFDLNSTKSFGQYNKEFVNWIWNQVVPVLVDPSIRAATQERFNAYLKTPLLKLHAALLFSVTGGPSLKNLAEAYQKQLSSPQGVESAFNLLYPMIANYPNPLRVTPESVGFWVRRTMDGTAETLMHSLMTVLNAYAPEDLKKLDATIKNSRSSK